MLKISKSSHFLSAIASGADWRDVSTQILKALEKTEEGKYPWNIGFLYISDHLVGDAESILNLFRSVLKIEHWVGTVGVGVCGMAEAAVDCPAISLLLGQIEGQEFFIFSSDDLEQRSLPEEITSIDSPLLKWLNYHDPVLTLVHGHPFAERDPVEGLQDLEEKTGGFLLGGLSSSRREHMQFANVVRNDPFSGVLFSNTIPIATALSQGCISVGPVHTITNADEYILHTLDDMKALDVFKKDLDSLQTKEEIQSSVKTFETPAEDRLSSGVQADKIHAAFPVSTSDQDDYLVRNLITVDPTTGSIAVAHRARTGERMLFVRRDNQTMRNDLSKTLIHLRERIQREQGTFAPKGALYVSCAARAFWQDQDGATEEMHIIQEILGDVPLAGFYSGGEINNARLYGYTGVIMLFL